MTSKVAEYKESIDKALHDSQKPWTGWLAFAEEKTGVKRLYIFLGVLGFLALYLLFGYAAQLVCNTIGFLYPAYCSMKAIESPQKGDDTKWLTYWTVYALLSIVEYPTDLLLHWFPFYWLVKAVFFTWCFWPTGSNGSVLLYEKLIRPRFLKHEGDVDAALSNIAGAVVALFTTFMESITEFATKLVAKKLIGGDSTKQE